MNTNDPKQFFSSFATRCAGLLALTIGIFAVAACDTGSEVDVRTFVADVEILEVDAEVGEELALELEVGSPVEAEALGLCDPGYSASEGCSGGTRKEINTTCYCGYGPGGPIYVETNCAGYPGTHVCCAAACSDGESEDGLD